MGARLEPTWIFSWWWAFTFFLRGADRDSRPPWSTWKWRSSSPLTMWKEKGGPFLGVSPSVTSSCRTLLPMGSPSCRESRRKHLQTSSSSLVKVSQLEPLKMAPVGAFPKKTDSNVHEGSRNQSGRRLVIHIKACRMVQPGSSSRLLFSISKESIHQAARPRAEDVVPHQSGLWRRRRRRWRLVPAAADCG